MSVTQTQNSIKEWCVSIGLMCVPLAMAAYGIYGADNGRNEDLCGVQREVRAEDSDLQVWEPVPNGNAEGTGDFAYESN